MLITLMKGDNLVEEKYIKDETNKLELHLNASEIEDAREITIKLLQELLCTKVGQIFFETIFQEVMSIKLTKELIHLPGDLVNSVEKMCNYNSYKVEERLSIMKDGKKLLQYFKQDSVTISSLVRETIIETYASLFTVNITSDEAIEILGMSNDKI